MKRTLALALLLPSLALAQEPNQLIYDYFDFGYQRTDWDIGSSTIATNGWSGQFSIGIREHVYLTGGYDAFDAKGVDGGSTYKRLGFGMHGGVGQRGSLFGELGFQSYDLDFGAGNMSSDPGYAAAGIRWNVADGYELRGTARYTETRKGTPAGIGQTALTVGGDIYLTNVAALSIDVTQDDESTTTFRIGMRFYHKKDSSDLRQRR